MVTPWAQVRVENRGIEFGYIFTFARQMPRGRRKDSTIPLSRALIIQRAYRDRKAKHLSELEDRCRKAEEENERLRVELQLARSDSVVASIHSDLVNRFT
jgi:hypothetical protein